MPTGGKAHSLQKARRPTRTNAPQPTATSIWQSVSACEPSDATSTLDVWLQMTEVAYQMTIRRTVSGVPPGGSAAAATIDG